MRRAPIGNALRSGCSLWVHRNRYPSRKKGFRNNAKKKTAYYIERDEQEREAFVEILENLPEDVEIYYGDESGFEQDYSRTYGYDPRGERVYGGVYGTHFGRTSVVGVINEDNEFSAGFAFKGSMNSDLYIGWLEQVFVPSIKNHEKSVLIIDNASHHPKDMIRDIAEEYGFSVIFLPKYSPDLNPIEKFWANVKNWLRLHLREFESFWDGFVRAFECR